MERRHWIVGMGVGAALLMGACDREGESGEQQSGKVTPGDVTEQASETARMAGELAQQQVEAYKAQAQEGLETVNASIDAIAQRADNLSGEAKVRAQQTLESLRQQRDQYRQRLAEASADSKAAWEEIKGGLDRAWSELRSATDSAMNEFGGAETPDRGDG